MPAEEGPRGAPEEERPQVLDHLKRVLKEACHTQAKQTRETVRERAQRKLVGESFRVRLKHCTDVVRRVFLRIQECLADL